MDNAAEAIKEVLLELNRPATAKEIKQLVSEKYPDKFKESTIGAHLYGCSANNPKAYEHHQSQPKILWELSDGKYELYDVQKHGEFSFAKGEIKPVRQQPFKPNATAPIVNLPFLIIDNQTFNLYKPANEAELENMVKEHSKQLFGNDSLYFDIKEIIKTKTEVGSIPDGYAITLADKQWYIIEVELASHDPYSHILPQITKFLNCIENHDNQHAIADSLYKSILEKPSTKAFMESVIEKDIHYFLTKLLTQRPTLIIIVDEKTEKLEEACRHLTPEIIEVKAFSNESNHVHLVSKRMKEEIHVVRNNQKETFTCLLCEENRFSGNEEQISEHLVEQHQLSEESQLIDSLPEAFRKSERTSALYQTNIPENELLELTPETFMSVVTNLGGINVTTSQMLKYFKIIHAEGTRWGKLRNMGKKLAKQQKIYFVKDEAEGIWKATLKVTR